MSRLFVNLFGLSACVGCLLACLSSFRRVHMSGAALRLIFISFEVREEFVNCDIGYIWAVDWLFLS